MAPVDVSDPSGRVRAAEWARLFREHCHAQRRAWQEDPEDNGRSELWLARAMGASAFIDWLGEET